MKNIKRTVVLAFLVVKFNGVTAQQNNSIVSDTSVILFKDTINVLAFDSATHTLPSIIGHQQNFSIVKHFKNIGSYPVIIQSTYTNDPHFICDYPNEPLIPGKTYAFKVCFTFSGGYTVSYRWNKTMGFVLSDQQLILLHFKGEVFPDQQ